MLTGAYEADVQITSPVLQRRRRAAFPLSFAESQGINYPTPGAFPKSSPGCSDCGVRLVRGKQGSFLVLFLDESRRYSLESGQKGHWRMLDVRNFWACLYPPILFLSLFASSVLTAAQNADEKDRKEKASTKVAATGAANLVKVEGKVRCEGPAPEYSIEVPDRPGHALTIAKRKCTWTEPLVILGAKTKEGVAVSFTERMEGTLHIHGFETDTLDNGEKLTWQSMGQVLAEKGPVDSNGRWSLMRGTGRFKGIKGGGTYEGTLEANDVLTLNFDGVYDATEIAEEKK